MQNNDAETSCFSPGLCLLIFFELTLSFPCLIIGIPLLVVGYYRPNYWVTDSIISIPLYPETYDGLGLYGSVEYINGTTFYPNREIYNLSFTIQNDIDNSLDLYLFHNLWGLNYSLDIIHSSNHIVFSVQNSFNMEPNKITNFKVHHRELFGTIARELVEYDFVNILCPLPTLITQKQQIDEYCRNSTYPVKDKTKVAKEFLGPFDFGGYDSLTFRFNYLEALPYNFIDIPQLYIGGFKETNHRPLLISGLFFVILGSLILLLIPTVLIMPYYCN